MCGLQGSCIGSFQRRNLKKHLYPDRLIRVKNGGCLHPRKISTLADAQKIRIRSDAVQLFRKQSGCRSLSFEDIVKYKILVNDYGEPFDNEGLSHMGYTNEDSESLTCNHLPRYTEEYLHLLHFLC